MISVKGLQLDNMKEESRKNLEANIMPRLWGTSHPSVFKSLKRKTYFWAGITRLVSYYVSSTLSY
jgi:hypothetical protein